MNSFSVPTFTNEVDERQQVCIKDTSPQAIALLKTKDPNLYYSIPSVKNTALLDKDLDLSDLCSLEEAEAASGGNKNLIVTRQSRFSFEYHSSKLMEDLFGLDDDVDFDTDLDEVEDEDLRSYLSHIESDTPRPSKSSDVLKVVSVPTFAVTTSKPRKISTKDMSSADLEELKCSDPFSYYSIASLRAASLRGEDVDLEDVSKTTERKSRISFECHGDVFLEGVLDEITSDEQDGEENIFRYLVSLKRSGFK